MILPVCTWIYLYVPGCKAIVIAARQIYTAVLFFLQELTRSIIEKSVRRFRCAFDAGEQVELEAGGKAEVSTPNLDLSERTS
jgi:hypothetical protein